MEKEENALVGKWFHSFADDKNHNVRWQGQVLNQVGPSDFLVQLYSALDGCPSILKVVSISDMYSFNFYGSDEEMREWYHAQTYRPDYNDKDDVANLFSKDRRVFP